MTVSDKIIVLSGIRATGQLHIGNFLGAIQFFVKLAREPDKLCLFFIANLHSLTTRQDPEAMMREMRDIVRWWLAAGIDPTHHVIFAQSSVPETCELTWLLNCLSPFGDLERMPHWKEKKDISEASDNAGLFTYPVLMAADILGPGAHLVPVGEDQNPHVEFARELARRFNRQVGEEVFPVPELMEQSIRVPGLKGAGKMGKSEPKGTINLGDDLKAVLKKCRGADKRLVGSDVEPRVGDEPGEPERCRVFSLQALTLAGQEDASPELVIKTGCRAGTLRCGDCKEQLADRITGMLAPLQDAYAEVAKKGDRYIDAILEDGGRRARALITPRVERAKRLMGVPTF